MVNSALADALDAALDGPVPEGPFKVGQRVRRLVRRPVMGTVVKLVTVETDDGRENTYDVQGAVVRLDRPDVLLDDDRKPVEYWYETVDSEHLDDGFWEIVS